MPTAPKAAGSLIKFKDLTKFIDSRLNNMDTKSKTAFGILASHTD